MLDKEEVKKVAELARLKLSEKEIIKHGENLAAILEYFEGLNSAPTENTEPLYNASGSANIVEGDKIIESFEQSELLANAPEKFEGFIKVKRVL